MKEVLQASRRFLLTGAGMASLGLAGASGYLRFNERSLIYLPADRAVQLPDARFGLAVQKVSYASTDGTKLSAWIMPAEGPAHRWLLICHGNYGNIGYGDRPAFYRRMRALGLSIMAFDYRGYGESEGKPFEDGLYRDALASWRYLTDSVGVPPGDIVIFGHSLGSGVAIQLATQVEAAALIVEGAYTSIPDVGAERYPILPVRTIATQRFPSLERIGHVAEPKLMLHSPTDDAIPFSLGRKLFEQAAPPREFVAVSGGHNRAFLEDSATWFGAVRRLLESLPPATLPAASPTAPRSLPDGTNPRY